MYYLLNDCRPPFTPPAPYPFSYNEGSAALSRRCAGEKLPRLPKISPSLQSIILRACEYDPKDRFESAAEMKRALERIR